MPSLPILPWIPSMGCPAASNATTGATTLFTPRETLSPWAIVPNHLSSLPAEVGGETPAGRAALAPGPLHVRTVNPGSNAARLCRHLPPPDDPTSPRTPA